MKITRMRFYDGARERVCRLGLAGLLFDIEDILLSTDVRLAGTSHGKTLRQLIDGAFQASSGWEKTFLSGIDWIKNLRCKQVFLARLGVELQVSSCADRSVSDVKNLRSRIIEGLLDVGVVVVPDDRLRTLLPDRTPVFTDVVRYVGEEFKEAMNCPFVIMAIEHDGPGEALPKQPRKS